MKPRTTNYVMTLDPKSSVDMEKLQSIRQTIKTVNKTTRSKIKVSVKARLGRNNPAAYKYKGKVVYTYKQEDASRFDIYIYNTYA